MSNKQSNLANPQLQTLLDRAWQTRLANFPMTIQFDYPVDTAVISLTGTQCALNCAHCGQHTCDT